MTVTVDFCAIFCKDENFFATAAGCVPRHPPLFRAAAAQTLALECQMQTSECHCICREIDDFEIATTDALERRGLGLDLTGCVLSHVCLLDRFPDHRASLPHAFSCMKRHDTLELLKKLGIWGNAERMMLLFCDCLQQANDQSAGCLLPYLRNLHHPSNLLHEACKYGRSSIVQQLVQNKNTVPCIRQLGLFAIGCDCFQSALLSKANEEEKALIVDVLHAHPPLYFCNIWPGTLHKMQKC